MHRPKRSTAIYFVLSCSILFGCAYLLAQAWPAAHSRIVSAARMQADQLIADAAYADPTESAIDYKLATWLDSSNEAGYIGIARAQIAAGHANNALTELERAGAGNEATKLDIRTLMELGKTNQAADRAAAIAAPGHPDEDLVLAGLSYGLADRPQDIPALIARVSSAEAARSLANAQMGNLQLANELYVSGLPESSRALLTSLPTSFERNLLLGRILLQRRTPSDLSTATDYLNNAISLNPSDIRAHQLLGTAYLEKGKTSESTNEQLLVQKLVQGKP